jgi:hypothetical protein
LAKDVNQIFLIQRAEVILLRRKEQGKIKGESRTQSLFAARACDHATLLAAYSFIAEFPALFFGTARITSF